MSDLAAFLRTRLAEDEILARKTLGRWEHKPNVSYHTVTRWRRALREVAAKRAILAEHAPKDEGWLPGDYVRCQRCRGEDRPVSRNEVGGITAWPCWTVRHLAAVYSDHPDYDPAWKP